MEPPPLPSAPPAPRDAPSVPDLPKKTRFVEESAHWPADVNAMVREMHGQSSKKVAKQFKIGPKIGSGSFGAVFEARHEASGCIVAIKVVGGEDADVQREMDIQQQQQCNEIVGFYGHFRKDEQLWLVMELCAIGAVTDLMKVCRCTLSEAQVAVVVRGALGGLRYMHEKKGVHRDIKTDNILLTSKGEPKLGDFGVSRQLQAGESRMRTIAGTPYFIAPEILSSESGGYDAKADIWSVGIAMIEMAQGVPPYFSEHPMRVLFFIPTKPAPTLDNPDAWSTHMIDFLASALTKDPSKRPDAATLLAHPWFENLGDCEPVFRDRIAEFNTIVEAAGSRSKALKALKSETIDEKKKPKKPRKSRRKDRQERRERRSASGSDAPPPLPDAAVPPPPTPVPPPPTHPKEVVAITRLDDDDDDSESYDEEHEALVLDYTHGRPLVFDDTREDGRCWFDPKHQVWLKSPDEDPSLIDKSPPPMGIPGGVAALRSGGAASPRASPRSIPPPPPPSGSVPPPPSGPVPPPLGSVPPPPPSDGAPLVGIPPPAVPPPPRGAPNATLSLLQEEQPFRFFLPDGSFKTCMAKNNWSTKQILDVAREKSGLRDPALVMLIEDADGKSRVLDERERPLLADDYHRNVTVFRMENPLATDEKTEKRKQKLLSELVTGKGPRPKFPHFLKK